MEYADRFPKNSQYVVTKELGYLLKTKLSLPYENKNKLKEYNKLRNTNEQVIIALNHRNFVNITYNLL